jgi:enoyl-CoA hydratase/carnithine racemase
VPAPISVDELLTRVALDDESLMGEPPVVVVDLSTGPAPGLELAAAASLRSLPAVIVGIGAVQPAGGRARVTDHVDLVNLVDVVDLVAGDEAMLAAALEQVAATPRAAVALALLLRGRAGRSLDEALVAESATYSLLQAGPEFARWRAGRPLRVRPPDPADAVLLSIEPGGLHVTLNRPHRHNAYSVSMRDGLVAALRVAAVDPELTVVLDGAGPSFSSGGDLDEFGSFPDPATSHLVRLTRSAARLLAQLGDRVEAHVHGACLGAGVELPAFCHRVVARADASFGLPELALGLIPGAGGTASLPPRIGRHRTMQLALTGERIDAPTARAWGLVDEVSA